MMTARKESFYERFFLVAQKLLPRHVLRGLMVRTKEEKHMTDKPNITDSELTVILGPILTELIEQHGEEKARELLKEAARREGLDPACIDLVVGEEPS